MFSSLLLVCTLDYSQCKAFIDTNIYETEDQCYESMIQGFRYFESQNLIIEAYDCYQWNTPLFDEKS